MGAHRSDTNGAWRNAAWVLHWRVPLDMSSALGEPFTLVLACRNYRHKPFVAHLGPLQWDDRGVHRMEAPTLPALVFDPQSQRESFDE